MKTVDTPGLWDDADVISCYTRAQAIEDGVLVDASALAREAGMKFPVTLTAGVWADCVALPAPIPGQDETGRLWDVLWMLFCAIKRDRSGGQDIAYQVLVRDADERLRLHDLHAVCGPGDDVAPVITIMLPGED